MDQPNVHGQLTLLLQECRDVAGRLAKFIGLAFHHFILQIPTLSVHRSHIVSLFLLVRGKKLHGLIQPLLLHQPRLFENVVEHLHIRGNAARFACSISHQTVRGFS
ncbi:hypothetical protein TcCL_ESM02292 [Trypanosoma cruzi]|nr:hypothetical protein TcCL_ESM02292 [Trypanosoma cruzi]